MMHVSDSRADAVGYRIDPVHAERRLLALCGAVTLKIIAEDRPGA